MGQLARRLNLPLRHYKTAYYDSALDDNQPWETWGEQGGADSAKRTNLRWMQTLANYQAPALYQGIDEALKDFVAKKKASMDDAWF